MLRSTRAWRAARVALQRRALSSNSSNATSASKHTADADVEALKSATPGITRIRKGGSANRVVEVDSTIARIIGSDWGDRRNQSVSLPMRLYWILFGLVLANGVYTYATGKDETYLVEKVQKKVDEKLGVVETNEFVVMADPVAAKTPKTPEATPAPAPERPSGSVPSAPVSVFSSSSAAALPFFHPSTQQQAARPKTKAELEAQLQQLRATQRQLQQELASGTSHRDLDDVAVEIRMLDQQKAQLKRMIKRV